MRVSNEMGIRPIRRTSRCCASFAEPGGFKTRPQQTGGRQAEVRETSCIEGACRRPGWSWREAKSDVRYRLGVLDDHGYRSSARCGVRVQHVTAGGRRVCLSEVAAVAVAVAVGAAAEGVWVAEKKERVERRGTGTTEPVAEGSALASEADLVQVIMCNKPRGGDGDGDGDGKQSRPGRRTGTETSAPGRRRGEQPFVLCRRVEYAIGRHSCTAIQQCCIVLGRWVGIDVNEESGEERNRSRCRSPSDVEYLDRYLGGQYLPAHQPTCLPAQVPAYYVVPYSAGQEGHAPRIGTGTGGLGLGAWGQV